MSTDAQLHDRLAARSLRARLAMADQRLDLPFAVAVITDGLPAVYDLNVVSVTSYVPPTVLLRSVERIAASVGWAHRRIEIDDIAIAEQLAGPLTAAGYARESLVTMALADEPTPAPDDGRTSRPSAVVAVDEQISLARALTGEQPWADTDALIDQMVERERRLARVAGACAVVAPPHAPVSRCLLLPPVGDAMAEIDAVGTLTARRGQGWSGAVMRHAIAAARADGATDVVLVADDDDWPRAWYGRLGFRVVGRGAAFHRPAEADHPM